MREFFEAFQIETPAGFLDGAGDRFTLFVYSSGTANRLGFMADIKKKEGFSVIMSGWEKTMEYDLKDLLTALGRVSGPANNPFQTESYEKVAYHALPLQSPDFGVFYSVSGNYLIFTTSVESLFKTIDKVYK